jgi:hypothetical protein
LGSDSQVLGTAGFIDMLVYYDGATVAGHARVALWIADACDLSGKSPIDDRSVVNAGSNLLTTVSSSGYSFFETGVVTGPLKQLNVADWETLPASVSANPFSVSGV